MIGLWIQGRLPPEHAAAWCCASLIPLAKKDGGVRPVAIGETVRRLVGKVLLQIPEVQEQASSLRPTQVGVGVPAAAEAVGIGAQSLVHHLDSTDGWACLQLDFGNAIN